MCCILLETCHCNKRLTTNWKEFPPYVGFQDENVSGIFPPVLTNAVSFCCETCVRHGESYVDFQFNGRNKSAKQITDRSFKSNIEHHTDLSFPVFGYTWQNKYANSYGFKSVIESPGVAFVINNENDAEETSPVLFAVIASLPILVFTLILLCAAGITIWFLVSPCVSLAQMHV